MLGARHCNVDNVQLTIKELADFIGKNHFSLIRLARHTEQRAKENSELALLIDAVRSQISNFEL